MSHNLIFGCIPPHISSQALRGAIPTPILTLEIRPHEECSQPASQAMILYPPPTPRASAADKSLILPTTLMAAGDETLSVGGVRNTAIVVNATPQTANNRMSVAVRPIVVIPLRCSPSPLTNRP